MTPLLTTPVKPINPTLIKKDFPLLSREHNGKSLVYLDSAATTQRPQSVIDAIASFYETSNANPHRGVYPLAEEATTRYEETRVRVARFLNAPSVAEVIFTRNATESINLVAHGWARKFLKAGDEILLTDMEHHANIVPWYMLAKERGVLLRSVPLTLNFELDLDAFKKLLNPKVKLVCVTAMSNVLGTLNDVKTIASLAHENGALCLVDGAQSVPHETTDVKDLDCDFLAFSAHKMLGPTGVGVLWAQEKLLNAMDPFLGGGEMINLVSLEETTWADLPHKFEAGTPNFADVAAFSTALDYLEALGLDAIRIHEQTLLTYALQTLARNPRLHIYGPKDPEKQGGALSFNHTRIHAHDVGTILGDEGLCVRVGHHCAQPLMRRLNVPSTARASFYIYNSTDDIDQLAAALRHVDRVFGL